MGRSESWPIIAKVLRAAPLAVRGNRLSQLFRYCSVLSRSLLERKARLQLVPLSADGNTPQKIVNRARTGTFASATPTPFNDAVILLDASHRP
jgi:hypothetical protein